MIALGVMKVLITATHQGEINGELYCYDRVIINATAGTFGYADGMRMFFNQRGYRIFDFANVFTPVTEQIKENAERLARENKLKIEYIRKKHAFRKEDRIKAIIKERGEEEGLVHIFSALELNKTYKPWHDKTTGRTHFKNNKTKCLTYYFYFIDREFGLCFIRVPTLAPYKVDFYFNGHNWLETKLRKREIPYQKVDNAFTHIADFEEAQKLSDRIRVEDLHKVLDVFIKKYCPMPEEWGLRHNYTISQVEYSLDILFESEEALKPLYDNIIKTATHTVTPDDIANFLGKRFSVFRNACNRYLEFISSFDDPTEGLKKLDRVTETVTRNDKNYKGFNFFCKEDEKILLAVADGKFTLKGITNKTLRNMLPEKKPWQISRILKRLRLHGLIKKIGHSYKYYLSSLGKQVIAAGLSFKNISLIPALSK